MVNGKWGVENESEWRGGREGGGGTGMNREGKRERVRREEREGRGRRRQTGQRVESEDERRVTGK